MARPQKTISFSELDKLLTMGAIGEECAGFFDIDYDTLNAIVKREKGVGFSDYQKKGSATFKISLRRLQYRSAYGEKEIITNKDGEVISGQYIVKPSVIMQIFLGKQYLGQSDKLEQTNKGESFSDWLEGQKDDG